ncbi:alpha-glucuronidase [Anaeromicropila populeti]|uniref:Alpha-glucuronidase n=1 Tax=Anaeromicropila populeti TaxID=37658 RepID=A0A1I6JHG4_9FIRM|nr:alpha-glucuronidase [Anaeromicropila populeti]SFR78428.1 alpha-glucuronidase [Anaeromicropila populeti]
MEYTNCWLQYRRISDKNIAELEIYCDLDGKTASCGIEELKIGFQELYGRVVKKVKQETEFKNCEKGILLKITTDISGKEEYCIQCEEGKCVISALTETGILYGVFSVLRNLQIQQVEDFNTWTYAERKSPSNPLRMLNHWDNMDGSIERGYSGESFFFCKNEVLVNERLKAYARMIASVGINGVVLNNVNVKGAATALISERYYEKLQLISELFLSYGIKLFLSINFAAPMELGGLAVADPCNEGVMQWWRKKANEIWDNIPGLGGFLVKADSEGRPGPFTYGRTHADGANMLARAIAPYEGIVIWRCFVYNCQQNWRDTKTDRARAGYDNFMPLDGMFEDNVILQIKNGPMDFQVREPVSPLFGALKNTNMMLELQIAQEYTGQQRHVCYLIPWFQQILGFNTFCKSEHSKVSDIVSGRTYNQKNCGMAAVANTGNDVNWTGHDLAAANLYGFGRLAFDTELNPECIGTEWVLQTFGFHEKVKETILTILMKSWLTYEKYTSPLGIGWMVKPNVHYGPDVDGYEYDRWGTYHRADHKAIGVDRTEMGTGYCSQYNEPLASIFADRKRCPEELLLFFHHVEYDYMLSTGKTVLQHIYDTHFEGAAEAAQFYEMWQKLKGLVDEDCYQRTLERFHHQKEHALEWRDVINSYFYRKTGVDDKKGRLLY